MLNYLLSLLLSVLPVASAIQGAPMIKCTPTGYSVDDGEFVASSDPLIMGLRFAKPGSVVTLDPGSYPPLVIGFGNKYGNADVSGTVNAPITIRAASSGSKRPRITARGGGDALRITQNKTAAYITFEGLEFIPGYRSAVIFYKQKGEGVHRGFRFVDCDILGEWNHAKGQGNQSKWGVYGQRLADFEWIGETRPSRIQNIKEEHAFYLQHNAGDVTLENIEASQIGRTFCQFTARAREGPPGIGNVIVRNCKVTDVGLAAGDNFKGGSAFTVTGNMPKATFLFENNTLRAGFNSKLHKLTRKGVPYGSGALVVWAEGEHKRVGSVTLKDNDFRYAKGTGDRPVVSLTAVKNVVLEGTNRFEAGASGIALSLDAPRSGGITAPLPLINVKVSNTTILKGRLDMKGHPAGAAEREEIGLTSQ